MGRPDTESRPRRASGFAAAACVCAAAAAALAAVNVWFGPLNQDEGWYLLSAQNVGRGLLPYRDFFYTQGPALPFAYALFLPLWSPFGVLGGRVLTAAFGLLAGVFAAAFAARAVPRAESGARAGFAALFAFSLLCLSPDWAYFSVIPKTYSLSSFYLCLGALLSSVAAEPGARRRRSFPAAALSGACFALAAATRASLCVAAPPFFLALLCDSGRRPLRRRAATAALFAAGCAVALAALLGPVLLIAPDNYLFAQTYHVARASAPLGRWLVLRAAFACFLLQGYPLMAVCAAFLLLKAGGSGSGSASALPSAAAGRPSPLAIAAAASFALLTFTHALVPFPYADYDTPAMPFAAAALAVPLSGLAVRAGLRPLRAVSAFCAVALALAAASPWPMKWAGGWQDRFWFHFEGRSALARLREAGAKVRELSGGSPGAHVFTQDAYLAVEAGLPVVPGFEMGPFGFFPDLSDGEAAARRVHNAVTALRAIESGDAPVAAFSGYAFAVGCPSTDPVPEETRNALLDAAARRWPVVGYSAERFGQQDTPLCVRTGAQRARP